MQINTQISTQMNSHGDSSFLRAQVMLTQGRLPLVFDKTRPARFGVLPKRPKSGKEIRWFELPPGGHVSTRYVSTRSNLPWILPILGSRCCT